MKKTDVLLPLNRPRVILCGPYPSRGRIGGYARCNELIASSEMGRRFGVARLPVTVPGEGPLAWRMAVDLCATLRCLTSCPAPIFHLTAQYQRGTYREWAQYRLARHAERAFVYDIRAGCFIEAYECSRAIVQRSLIRSMIKGASLITVEGRPYIRWMEANFGRSPIWIPNFVKKSHRDRYPQAALDRPREGEPLKVAYAGRLIPEKGLPELIEAIALLRSRRIRAELTLAGPDEAGHYRALRRKASLLLPEGAVRFTGRLDHGPLLRLLASQHLFAFPTRWHGEGHPNSVNEAMQLGLPVVTTRQGFLSDVVTPECGYVVDTPEPDNLVRAIASLASDWDRLRAAGRASMKRVYSEFSDEVVLGRLEESYEALLQESS